eukprot:TRINITY_DN5327_c0_g1_i1.p1 TRINITY_DN5327_c0_g1~~TRINITY_DN5327_c0_g1_i1.p1  ORF type:complete len:239 (+),score=47.17 TRINITY_DN5327_c0_g1_i1:66-719(+)
MAALSIYVRLPGGDTCEVTVPAGGTVADAAEQVAAVMQCGPEDAKPALTFQGETLRPEALLADTGISSQAMLDVAVRPRFEVGHRIEAVDVKTPGLICVATIADVSADHQRVKIHFDGWTNVYDYWDAADSDNIAPIHTCFRIGMSLQPPRGYQQWKGSTSGWDDYLAHEGATAAPRDCFARRDQFFASALRGWRQENFIKVESKMLPPPPGAAPAR